MAAVMLNSGCQRKCKLKKVVNIIFAKNPKIANFGIVEKNMVVISGDPSYTSGLQTWNGTAVSLKRKPHNIKINPNWKV